MTVLAWGYEVVMRAGADLVPVMDYLEKHNQPMPNPLLSVAWTAEVEGEIVGVIVVQSIPVVEPLKVDEGYQSSDIGLRLFREAEKWIKESGAPRVWMHTANPTMEKILLKHGANEIGEKFFEWQR